MPSLLIVILCILSFYIICMVGANCFEDFTKIGKVMYLGWLLLVVAIFSSVIYLENTVKPEIEKVTAYNIVSTKSKDGAVTQYYDKDGELVKLGVHFDVKQIKITEYRKSYYGIRLMIFDKIEGVEETK